MNAVCTHICKSCYAKVVCAIRALQERTDAIILDSAKCIGCGCCLTACNTFGHSMIKHKSIKPERLKPLPGTPTPPFPKSQ